MSNRRGILYITGVLLLVGPPALWFVSSVPTTPHAAVLLTAATVEATPVRAPDLVKTAQRDPMSLVRLGRERYREQVRDYRCVLIKQERLGKKLSDVQEIELRFREAPWSVYMLWKKNADQAKRALYMDTPEFVDEDGRKLSRVEPAGAIARLFVKDIFIPVRGERARKASRRTIDEAGFRATFELLESFNAVAAQRGVLDLRYVGTGTIDGRPTYVIVRDLPYEGPDGPYPDARMILHLDQEWLLPVAVYSYADHAEQELLGSYLFTQIELNPGLSDDAFKF